MFLTFNKYLKWIVLLIILSFNNFGFGQNVGGYFNYDKVKTSLPSYKMNKKAILELEKKYNDSLILLMRPFQKVVSHAPNIDYTSLGIKKMQDSIQKMELKINMFNKLAIQSIKVKRIELNKSMDRMMFSQISNFCRFKKISFLTPKNETFYCEGCMDYTNELIEFIRLNYSKTKK